MFWVLRVCVSRFCVSRFCVRGFVFRYFEAVRFCVSRFCVRGFVIRDFMCAVFNVDPSFASYMYVASKEHLLNKNSMHVQLYYDLFL